MGFAMLNPSYGLGAVTQRTVAPAMLEKGAEAPFFLSRPLPFAADNRCFPRPETTPWPTRFPNCPMPTTRWSRTSTRRRWRSTTSKHHQTYITNLNDALEGTDVADSPIED